MPLIHWQRLGWQSLLAGAAGVLAIAGAAAQVSEPPRVQTIEGFVDEVTGTDHLDIKDAMAVLDVIFGSLPQRVKVYPTENYFYFRFVHNGLQYAGNFRLDVPSSSTSSLMRRMASWWKGRNRWFIGSPIRARLFSSNSMTSPK
jgi:hypothetical protein